MALNTSPESFFGTGYSADATTITMKLASDTSFAGDVITGVSFALPLSTADATANTITTNEAHGLSKDDRVKVTTTGTLPTGLNTSSVYWVTWVGSSSTVSGASINKLQLATTRGGVAIDITGGSGGASAGGFALMGLLDEITDDMADEGAGGDWRKVIAGVMEMFNQRFNRLPLSDRSTKLIVTKALSASGGVNSVEYRVRITYAAPRVTDVAPE